MKNSLKYWREVGKQKSFKFKIIMKLVDFTKMYFKTKH